MGTIERTFKRTHPWLTFEAHLEEAPPLLWILLGEARSKCEHLAGVPLPPGLSDYFHRLYLAKGMQGTTAIEGNTLTVEQVEQHLEGKLDLPPSQKYLQQELDNILAACRLIEADDFHEGNPEATPELVKTFNRTVLNGLELDPQIEPGEIRKIDVGVLRYLGAPSADCEYLLERMCSWLNSPAFAVNEDFGLAVPILKAILAHLYIAWIHPFGDGNGRTARLIEFYTLVHAGVPSPAAHLLSNHYNLTRAAYYRELDKASRSGGKVVPFIMYALQGFVDQLRQQIVLVQSHQVAMAWRDFIGERFEHKASPSDARRRRLLRLLSWRPEPLSRREMLKAPEIALNYHGKTIKTLTRDLNGLIGEGLVRRTSKGYRANVELIFGFLPPRRAQNAAQLRAMAMTQLKLALPPMRDARKDGG